MDLFVALGCIRSSKSVGRTPGGAFGPLGAARIDYMRDILVLNEIWAQGKIYILEGTWLR
jgi:hypothetical protein